VDLPSAGPLSRATKRLAECLPRLLLGRVQMVAAVEAVWLRNLSFRDARDVSSNYLLLDSAASIYYYTIE
jgi:hypothetical protein